MLHVESWELHGFDVVAIILRDRMAYIRGRVDDCSLDSRCEGTRDSRFCICSIASGLLGPAASVSVDRFQALMRRFELTEMPLVEKLEMRKDNQGLCTLCLLKLPRPVVADSSSQVTGGSKILHSMLQRFHDFPFASELQGIQC